MQARILPFRRGVAWLTEGFSLWRKSPALITYLAFGYLLMLILGSLIPLLGQVITAFLMPIFSVGVLNGCKAVHEGKKTGPEILFSGFSSNIRGLAQVGGAYFAGSVMVLLVVLAIDDGPVKALLQGQAIPVDPSDPTAPRLTQTLLVGILVSMPVVMAYWFAPMLTGWYRLPAAKALFFSLVACWRNWRAFLGYSLALLAFAGLLPGVLLGLLGSVSGFLAGLVSLLLPLVLIPVIFASFYINARDVFMPEETPPPETPVPVSLDKTP